MVPQELYQMEKKLICHHKHHRKIPNHHTNTILIKKNVFVFCLSVATVKEKKRQINRQIHWVSKTCTQKRLNCSRLECEQFFGLMRKRRVNFMIDPEFSQRFDGRKTNLLPTVSKTIVLSCILLSYVTVFTIFPYRAFFTRAIPSYVELLTINISKNANKQISTE